MYMPSRTTLSSLRASVRAIGPKFNKYFEENRVQAYNRFVNYDVPCDERRKDDREIFRRPRNATLIARIV